MNSLEYINREISSTEIDLWYSKRLLIENPPSEELKKEMLEIKINVLERNMKCLQQIKAELEAWYFVNDQLCLRIADHENKLLGTKYGLQVEYDNIIPLTDEETKIFIKAQEIEVEDNE